MRHGLLALGLATATCALTARGADPAGGAGRETEPANARWSLPDGLPVPTLGGMQLWGDEHFFHRWRIQRNALSGRCRLLDGNNLRRASGTYEHCRARLEAIKRSQNLPPMRGKAVIALHGLADTRLSMSLLCKHLKEHGGYTAFNVSYPSTRRSVRDHAQALAKIVQGLDGIDEISFVGHSLGNIVIRHYLADRADAATGRGAGPRIGRFVMLGPPNHGSDLAVRLGDENLLTAMLGEPSQELGRHWTWLESELAVPACEFGIIAGGLGNDRGFNPLIPGDDDGVVAVSSTRLPGAADFLVLPLLHPLLPIQPGVARHTLCFLRNGYFVSADQREPVRAGDEG